MNSIITVWRSGRWLKYWTNFLRILCKLPRQYDITCTVALSIYYRYLNDDLLLPLNLLLKTQDM